MAEAKDRYQAIFSGKDRLSGTLGKMGSSLAMFVGGFVAFRAVSNLLTSSIQAAADTEKAYNDLAASVDRAGGSWEKAEGAIRNFTSTMQTQTGLSDEAVARSIQMGVDYGNSLEDSFRIARLSADLAAGANMDLAAATDLLAKASVGYTGTLSRYGIILDESLSKTEKFEAAMELIETRFGGAAAARLDTYAGKLALLNERWGDLKETIGGVMAMPLARFFEQMSIAIDRFRIMVGGGTEVENLLAERQDAIDDMTAATVRLALVTESAHRQEEQFGKQIGLTGSIMHTATEAYNDAVHRVGELDAAIAKLIDTQGMLEGGPAKIIAEDMALAAKTIAEFDFFGAMMEIAPADHEKNLKKIEAFMLDVIASAQPDPGEGSIIEQMIGDASDAEPQLNLMQQSAAATFDGMAQRMTSAIMAGGIKMRIQFGALFRGMANDFIAYFIQGAIKALAEKFAVKVLKILAIFDKQENDRFAMSQGADFASFFMAGATGALASANVGLQIGGRAAGAIGAVGPVAAGPTTVNNFNIEGVHADDTYVRLLAGRLERLADLQGTRLMTQRKGM